MDAIFIRQLKSRSRPAGTSKTSSRQNTDWASMSNENLKFALDLLFRHQATGDLVAALEEVQRRIDRGAWLDLDEAVINTDDLPTWLTIWPFCLLSRQQRKKRRSRK